MASRIALFLDYQNVYRGARDAFEPANALPSYGQVDPKALANLICGRSRPPGDRMVSDVRVYVGRPSAEKDPKGYAANRRQIAAWQAKGITVVARSLRYPPNYPSIRPMEKGIDVSLAVDFVGGAVDGLFDVGIIFSTDTDLVPALEFVTHRSQLSVTAEVAAWWGANTNRPLRVDGQPIWCHRLERTDYEKVKDPTVYVS